MEDITRELKTLFITIVSICYCYFIPPQNSHGLPRFLSLLPIITLFPILPLPISTVDLAFPTFFFVAWLANFNLFLSVFPTFFFLHWSLIIVIYYVFMHIGLDLGFAITAFSVKTIFGFHFRMETHLATPWNFIVSSIFRTTVYNQIHVIFTSHFGRLWGQLVAVFVTFVVSGLMHELMFLCLARVGPTWEVTWVFALYCVVVEVAVKKAVSDNFRLNRAVGGPRWWL